MLGKLVEPTEIQLIPRLKASIEIVEARRSHTKHEGLGALDTLYQQGYEGVIAKNPDKRYVLGKRGPDIGIKLKPDYFGGGLADIDVLILGV